MPDLLIQDVPDELKSRIEAQARLTRTSVSEAAKALLERGLERPQQGGMGTKLFNLLPQEFRSDDLVFEIPAAAGSPPDFS